MKIFNKIAIFLIWIYQKTLSSHTWILKNILYDKPICAHYPNCSKYAKECFQKYDFINWLKYTMNRISKCTPSNTIKYDPSSYKVVFLSSAPIWIPFLEKLYNDKRFEIVWILTMPDAQAWRWQKLKSNIIKKWWIENIWENLPIFTPEKIKNNKKIEENLKKLDADFFVVLAYWKILPKSILDIPKLGSINIHWSILPKYRWASPIQSVFLNKEKETGITIMYMDEWMDTWDIIKILKIPLKKEDNTKTLINKFIQYWPDFFVNVLWDFWKWELNRQKQNNSEATYCKKFTKQDGQIDFNKPAWEIYNQFQAFYLWPWIFTIWNWKHLNFTDIDFEEKQNIKKNPWTVFQEDWKIKISCWKWNIIIKKVKLEWKKELSIKDFLNWHKDFLKNK